MEASPSVVHSEFRMCYNDTQREVVAMASTEAQKRASAKYQKEKTKQVNLKFSPNEMEMYRWLTERDGTASGTVKDLIRKAMEEEK